MKRLPDVIAIPIQGLLHEKKKRIDELDRERNLLMYDVAELVDFLDEHCSEDLQNGAADWWDQTGLLKPKKLEETP